jgi:hypothetical protein
VVGGREEQDARREAAHAVEVVAELEQRLLLLEVALLTLLLDRRRAAIRELSLAQCHPKRLADLLRR